MFLGRGLLPVRSLSAGGRSASASHAPAELLDTTTKSSGTEQPHTLQTKRSRSWFSVFRREEPPPPLKVVSQTTDDAPWLPFFKKKEVHQDALDQQSEEEKERNSFRMQHQALICQPDVVKITQQDLGSSEVAEQTPPSTTVENRLLELQAQRIHPFQARISNIPEYLSSVRRIKSEAIESQAQKFHLSAGYDKCAQTQYHGEIAANYKYKNLSEGLNKSKALSKSEENTHESAAHIKVPYEILAGSQTCQPNIADVKRFCETGSATKVTQPLVPENVDSKQPNKKYSYTLFNVNNSKNVISKSSRKNLHGNYSCYTKEKGTETRSKAGSEREEPTCSGQQTVKSTSSAAHIDKRMYSVKLFEKRSPSNENTREYSEMACESEYPLAANFNETKDKSKDVMKNICQKYFYKPEFLKAQLEKSKILKKMDANSCNESCPPTLSSELTASCMKAGDACSGWENSEQACNESFSALTDLDIPKNTPKPAPTCSSKSQPENVKYIKTSSISLCNRDSLTSQKQALTHRNSSLQDSVFSENMIRTRTTEEETSVTEYVPLFVKDISLKIPKPEPSCNTKKHPQLSAAMLKKPPPESVCAASSCFKENTPHLSQVNSLLSTSERAIDKQLNQLFKSDKKAKEKGLSNPNYFFTLENKVKNFNLQNDSTDISPYRSKQILSSSENNIPCSKVLKDTQKTGSSGAIGRDFISLKEQEVDEDNKRCSIELKTSFHVNAEEIPASMAEMNLLRNPSGNNEWMADPSMTVHSAQNTSVMKEPQFKQCIPIHMSNSGCLRKHSFTSKMAYSTLSCIKTQTVNNYNSPKQYNPNIKIGHGSTCYSVRHQSKTGGGKKDNDKKCKKLPFGETATQVEGECTKLVAPGCIKPKKTECEEDPSLRQPCTRLPTPWPSYSECLKEETPPPRFTECKPLLGKTCEVKEKKHSYDGCRPPNKRKRSLCPDQRPDAKRPPDKSSENPPCEGPKPDDCKRKCAGPPSSPLRCYSSLCHVMGINQRYSRFEDCSHSNIKLNNFAAGKPVQCQYSQSSGSDKKGKDKCAKLPFGETATQVEGECTKLVAPGCIKPKKTECEEDPSLRQPCTRLPTPWPSYSECLKEETPPPRFTECKPLLGKTCEVKEKKHSYDGCRPPNKRKRSLCPDQRPDAKRPPDKSSENPPCTGPKPDDCKRKCAGTPSSPVRCYSSLCHVEGIKQENSDLLSCLYNDLKMNNGAVSTAVRCQPNKYSGNSKKEKENCKKMLFGEVKHMTSEGVRMKLVAPTQITSEMKKEVPKCTRVPPPWLSYSECFKDRSPSEKFSVCNPKWTRTCDVGKKKYSYDGYTSPSKGPNKEGFADKSHENPPFKGSKQDESSPVHLYSSLRCSTGTKRENLSVLSRLHNDLKMNNVTDSRAVQCQPREYSQSTYSGKIPCISIKKSGASDKEGERRKEDDIKRKSPGSNKVGSSSVPVRCYSDSFLRRSVPCRMCILSKSYSDVKNSQLSIVSYFPYQSDDPAKGHEIGKTGGTKCNKYSFTHELEMKSKNERLKFAAGTSNNAETAPCRSESKLCEIIQFSSYSKEKGESHVETIQKRKPHDRTTQHNEAEGLGKCGDEENVLEFCEKPPKPSVVGFSSTPVGNTLDKRLTTVFPREKYSISRNYSNINFEHYFLSKPNKSKEETEHNEVRRNVCRFTRTESPKREISHHGGSTTENKISHEQDSFPHEMPSCATPSYLVEQKHEECYFPTHMCSDVNIIDIHGSQGTGNKKGGSIKNVHGKNISQKKKIGCLRVVPSGSSRLKYIPPKNETRGIKKGTPAPVHSEHVKEQPSNLTSGRNSHKKELDCDIMKQNPSEEVNVPSLFEGHKMAGFLQAMLSSNIMEHSGFSLTNNFTHSFYFPKHYFSTAPNISLAPPASVRNTVGQPRYPDYTKNKLLSQEVASLLFGTGQTALMNNVIKRHYSEDQKKDTSDKEKCEEMPQFEESRASSNRVRGHAGGKCDQKTVLSLIKECTKPPDTKAFTCEVKKKKKKPRKPVVKEVPKKTFIECKKPIVKTVKCPEKQKEEVLEVIPKPRVIKTFIECQKPPPPRKLDTCAPKPKIEKVVPTGRCRMVQVQTFIECSKPPSPKGANRECVKPKTIRRICHEQKEARSKLCYIPRPDEKECEVPSKTSSENNSKSGSEAPKQSRAVSTDSRARVCANYTRVSKKGKLGFVCKKTTLSSCRPPSQPLKWAKYSKLVPPPKAFLKCGKSVVGRQRAYKCTLKVAPKYLRPNLPHLEHSRYKSKPASSATKCTKRPHDKDKCPKLTGEPCARQRGSLSFMDCIKTLFSFFKAREGCPQPGQRKKRKPKRPISTVANDEESTVQRVVKDAPRGKCKTELTAKEFEKILTDDSQCKRIQQPGCKPPFDVVCKPRPQKTVECKKVLAPKPSFSECEKDPLGKSKFTECNFASIKESGLKKSTQRNQLECEPEEKIEELKGCGSEMELDDNPVKEACEAAEEVDEIIKNEELKEIPSKCRIECKPDVVAVCDPPYKSPVKEVQPKAVPKKECRKQTECAYQKQTEVCETVTTSKQQRGYKQKCLKKDKKCHSMPKEEPKDCKSPYLSPDYILKRRISTSSLPPELELVANKWQFNRFQKEACCDKGSRVSSDNLGPYLDLSTYYSNSLTFHMPIELSREGSSEWKLEGGVFPVHMNKKTSGFENPSLHQILSYSAVASLVSNDRVIFKPLYQAKAEFHHGILSQFFKKMTEVTRKKSIVRSGPEKAINVKVKSKLECSKMLFECPHDEEPRTVKVKREERVIDFPKHPCKEMMEVLSLASSTHELNENQMKPVKQEYKICHSKAQLAVKQNTLKEDSEEAEAEFPKHPCKAPEAESKDCQEDNNKNKEMDSNKQCKSKNKKSTRKIEQNLSTCIKMPFKCPEEESKTMETEPRKNKSHRKVKSQSDDEIVAEFPKHPCKAAEELCAQPCIEEDIKMKTVETSDSDCNKHKPEHQNQISDECKLNDTDEDKESQTPSTCKKIQFQCERDDANEKCEHYNCSYEIPVVSLLSSADKGKVQQPSLRNYKETACHKVLPEQLNEGKRGAQTEMKTNIKSMLEFSGTATEVVKNAIKSDYVGDLNLKSLSFKKIIPTSCVNNSSLKIQKEINIKYETSVGESQEHCTEGDKDTKNKTDDSCYPKPECNLQETGREKESQSDLKQLCNVVLKQLSDSRIKKDLKLSASKKDLKQSSSSAIKKDLKLSASKKDLIQSSVSAIKKDLRQLAAEACNKISLKYLAQHAISFRTGKTKHKTSITAPKSVQKETGKFPSSTDLVLPYHLMFCLHDIDKPKNIGAHGNKEQREDSRKDNPPISADGEKLGKSIGEQHLLEQKVKPENPKENVASTGEQHLLEQKPKAENPKESVASIGIQHLLEQKAKAENPKENVAEQTAKAENLKESVASIGIQHLLEQKAKAENPEENGASKCSHVCKTAVEKNKCDTQPYSSPIREEKLNAISIPIKRYTKPKKKDKISIWTKRETTAGRARNGDDFINIYKNTQKVPSSSHEKINARKRKLSGCKANQETSIPIIKIRKQSSKEVSLKDKIYCSKKCPPSHIVDHVLKEEDKTKAACYLDERTSSKADSCASPQDDSIKKKLSKQKADKSVPFLSFKEDFSTTKSQANIASRGNQRNMSHAPNKSIQAQNPFGKHFYKPASVNNKYEQKKEEKVSCLVLCPMSSKIRNEKDVRDDKEKAVKLTPYFRSDQGNGGTQTPNLQLSGKQMSGRRREKTQTEWREHKLSGICSLFSSRQ